ncbi:hypothetical protein DGN16_04950 [Xanthomonas citri pv. fuscans]|uniref:Uncharacterized protein n=1 Tax=Xanthomonas citri pv. phaseoli var. fuscans TaxID=473423 RepID=A0A808FHB7_XANCI|nr:hypothetical protein DGN16_04950 [Xanthomonas citri pv. fuscans]QWN06881.1 hypothetical protein DGN11_04970 [Xanthomonas citri pv. fuscans]QWN11014.1 hypothetical protein DGN07_04920 [Xanthomonas citri pv. fuscans]
MAAGIECWCVASRAQMLKATQGRSCPVALPGALTRADQSRGSRRRGALTACGTRRKSVSGGSMAAPMPPSVPQAARALRQTRSAFPCISESDGV